MSQKDNIIGIQEFKPKLHQRRRYVSAVNTILRWVMFSLSIGLFYSAYLLFNLDMWNIKFVEINGLTKIGRAKCAKSRLNGMLTANPRIRLLFYYRATEIEELKWHEIFSEKREYREWFRLEVETLELIQNFLLAKSSEQ